MKSQIVDPAFNRYYQVAKPIPVYQPTKKEYRSYLASKVDILSPKGRDTINRWYVYSMEVLSS